MPLQDKLRARHVEAVAAFQTDMTQTSANLDRDVTSYLVNLRTTLTDCRAESGRLIDDETELTQRRREATARLTDGAASPDESCWLLNHVTPDGCLHTEPASTALDIERVCDERPARIAAERLRVTRVATSLHGLHQRRLELIVAAGVYLAEMERRRRDELRRRLEALQVELSTIAYVGVTEAQVLVQRAALSANKQLLSNAVEGQTLIAQLTSHEYLRQRQFAKAICSVFDERQEWMTAHIVQWTSQAARCRAYRRPPHRLAVKDCLSKAVAQARKDVGFALAGLEVMVNTLVRQRTAGREEVPPVAPGGTDAGGWLRSFNHDESVTVDEAHRPQNNATIIFMDTPAAFEERLHVSLAVLVDQIRSSSERLLSDAQTGEDEMLGSFRRVVDAMLRDVAGVFALSKADVEGLTQCACPTTTADTKPPSRAGGDLSAVIAASTPSPPPLLLLTPFDSILNVDAQRVALHVASARAALDAPLDSIDFEARSVIEAMAMQLFQHTTELANGFLTGSQGILPVLGGATTYLYDTASTTVAFYRGSKVHQDCCERDYRDALFRLELDFSASEDATAHAGTVPLCGKHFEAAMASLKAIQQLYVTNHRSRTSMMPQTQTDLAAKLEAAVAYLMSALHVITEDAYRQQLEAQQHQEQMLAAPTSPTNKPTRSPATGHRGKGGSDLLAPTARPTSSGAETLEKITLPNGRVFHVKKPLCISFSLSDEEGGGGPSHGLATLTTAAAGSKPSAIATGGEPKKPPGKAGGGSAAKGGGGGDAAAASTGDGADRPKTSDAGGADGPWRTLDLSTLSEDRQRFIVHLRSELLTEELFYPGCLLPLKAQSNLFSCLRRAMLHWILDFQDVAVTGLQAFHASLKTQLDSDTNDRIRLHYRRAPALQSHVYDVRVRELEDASRSRDKYFTWLTGRVDATIRTATLAISETQPAVVAALGRCSDMTKDLPAIHTNAGLETHQRTFAETSTSCLARAEERLASIPKTAAGTLAGVTRECDAYLSERVKTFDEGGTVSATEAAEASAECHRIRMLAQKAAEEVQQLVDDARQKTLSRFAEEKSVYEKAFSVHQAEVAFLRRVSDMLTQLRGKVTTQLSQSTAAGVKVGDVLAAFEKLTAPPSTPLQDLLSAGESLLATDLESPLARPVLPSSGTAVPVPDDWQGDDVVGSQLLRRIRLTVEATQWSQCKANRILLVWDELRQLLYTRGLVLGCLVSGVPEFPLIPKEQFFDPLMASSSAMGTLEMSPGTPAGNQRPGKAGAPAPAAQSGDKKAAGGKIPAGKGSDVPAPNAASATHAVDDPYRFMKASRLDADVNRLLQTGKEQVAQLVTPFFASLSKAAAAAAGGGSATLHRADWLGGDAAAVMKTVQGCLTEQEGRVAEHMQAAAAAYREQLSRLQLAAHRAAAEIMTSIANVCLETLNLKATDIVAVFTAYYLSSATAKRQHQDELRATLSAPSHAAQFQKLLVEEDLRGRVTKEFVRRSWGALTWEVQDAVRNMYIRCGHVLTVLFAFTKSTITPEHVLAGGDIIVGEHRSIKKLLRLRQREMAARALEQQNGSSSPTAAAGKGGAKGAAAATASSPPPTKVEPKKPGQKPGGKKGEQDGSAADDSGSLPPLERPTQEYPAAQLPAQAKVFDAWRKSGYHDVALRTYAPNERPVGGPGADSSEQQESAAGKSGGKTTAAAKAAAKPPPAKVSAAQALPVDGSAGSVQDDALQLLAAAAAQLVVAPKDRLHQSAWLTRQSAVDHFAAVAGRFVDTVTKKFAAVETSEQQWDSAWQQSVLKLKRQ